MKIFTQKLLESLRSPLKFERKDFSEEGSLYTFYIGEDRYSVLTDLMFNTKTIEVLNSIGIEKHEAYDIEFYVMGPNDITPTFELTGKGVGFKVISTVIAIIKKELLSRPRIKAITFVSNNYEGNRSRVYTSIVTAFTKKTGGIKSHIHKEGDTTYFVLYKGMGK